MGQVDAVLRRHNGDAQGQRHQVDAGQLAVFPPTGGAGQPAGQQRHRQSGDDAAQPHRPYRDADCCRAQSDAGQDAVLEHVAHQAHAPQHQKHAQRRPGK